MDEEQAQTSVRAIISCPNGSRIVTSGFPGLQTSIDGSAYIDPHNLSETIAALQAAKAETLVVLTESEELPEDAMPLLMAAAKQAEVRLAALPIPDYSAPDDATLAQWSDLVTRIGWPENRGTIAVCCQHGAGRSGTIAAYALMRQGLSKDQAITAVRAEFEESIESEVQLEFLEMISARLKDEADDLDPDKDDSHTRDQVGSALSS
jgi:protein-tyrosine phosphatase